MKRYIAGACLLSLLVIGPHSAHAQIASTDRMVLLKQIELLIELIQSLQQQVLLKRQAEPNSRPVTTPTANTEVVPSGEKSLSSFRLAESTWKSRFIQSESQIPSSGFLAFYFDSTDTDTVVRSERVDQIGISYPWSDGPGFTIDSEDFGGYWIGKIVVDARGVYTLNVSESWADARVLIDGRIILSGQGATNVVLEPGVHTLEAEFLNNWHTTDFSVTLTPERKILTKSQLSSSLPKLNGFVNWYVGAYESGNSDRSIDVTLRRSSSPVVLTLASYSQAHWKVSADDMPAAVIVSSYEPGSTVSGLDSNVPIYYTDYSVIEYEYDLDVDCDDYDGTAFVHCEYIDQLSRIDDDLAAVTGRKIDGFSGDYALESTIVPEQTITNAVRASYEAQYEDARDAHEAERNSQRIETLF